MHDYRKIGWYRICQLWAEHEGPGFAKYLARYLASNQFGIFTRKHLQGRMLTEPEAGRFYQCCLRKHRLYPADRPATLADLKAIRQDILNDRLLDELL